MDIREKQKTTRALFCAISLLSFMMRLIMLV